jgi:GNAT superfamily N-acetyltransferase
MRVTRTYLELQSPGQFRPAFGTHPDITVAYVPAPAPGLYRQCYRSVGEAYHWRDRWDWTDEEIRAHLAAPAITFFLARRRDVLAGYYELRQVPEDHSVEVAYFGVAPAEIGRGLGKHLLSCAVRDAWALGPVRVWLHTCTLDHANALPNYLARGFVPYKREEYEVDLVT